MTVTFRRAGIILALVAQMSLGAAPAAVAVAGSQVAEEATYSEDWQLPADEESNAPAPEQEDVAGTQLPGDLSSVTAPQAPAPAPALLPSEKALLDLTNADRAHNGEPALVFDPSLLTIARQRAATQLTLPELSHYDASGQLVFVGLLSGARVDYLLAGENLARSTGVDATVPPRVDQALMNSPLHRKNILEPGFNRIAIGAATDASGRTAFAQIFRQTP